MTPDQLIALYSRPENGGPRPIGGSYTGLCAQEDWALGLDLFRKGYEAGQKDERARADGLQHIIDSRPAINAGLIESYMRWTRSIYAGEIDDAIARSMPLPENPK